MLRLGPLLAFVVLGCANPESKVPPPDVIHFPVGIAADPAGDFVYVVNSNFDLAFATGNVVAIDTRTHRAVSSSAVRIPTFGGQIAALGDPQTGATRLYMTTRDLDALIWARVDRDAAGNPHLVCSEAPPAPGEQATCDGRFVIGGPGEPLSPGNDPFGLAVAPDRKHLFAASFEGKVAAYTLDATGDPTFGGRADTFSGTYAVAVHPVTGRAYATTKSFNVLFDVKVVDATPPALAQVTATAAVGIQNQIGGRDFGRGIAFNASGTLAFVAYRSPPSLLVVDTALDADGLPRNRILGSVPLGDGPAGVAVAKTGPDGRELVYVTAFTADTMYVVDPLVMDVVAVIDVGDGPFDIAIVDRPGERQRAYITLFEEQRVSVVELDRTSPFYHQEIARVP